ncbi:MAG: mechanosensitive ion channel [Deltaproteobacteria bacterium]|nr:MAG: mechanosensitive ion channel [Deltaproteobacteria bacterium]
MVWPAIVAAAAAGSEGSLEHALDVIEVADAPSISPLELLFVFLGGVALFVVVRVFRWAFPLIPMTRERRARWARVGPIGEVVLWLTYLVSVLAWTLSGYPSVRLMALGFLVLVLVVGVFAVIRDYLSGVVLRSEGAVRVGDVVRVGEVEGTIARFRARAVEIDMAHGDRVVLPYRELGREAIVRRSRQRSAVRHTFTVELPAGASSEAARDTIRRAAVLCHWVPPRQEPKIAPLPSGALEVTIHAMTDLRTADVEAAVRAALVGRGAT